MLHQKLIINAVINPLTALFQVKNIEIIHNPYIRSLAKKICKEASDILHLDPDQEWCRIQTIATQTGENQSSMFVDLKRKQPTELEAILGYLLKEKKHKMPYTTFIYESIKALEYKIGV